MCGRYTLHVKADELAKRYNIARMPHDIRENFNVAPGQTMPVIVEAGGERQLELMQWGLIPFWAKDPRIGYKLINARDDTIFDKPIWRNVILKKRCLVPASGFYEWQKLPDAKKERKQPFYIHPKQTALLDSFNIHDSPDPYRPATNGFSAIDVASTTPPSDKTASISSDKIPGRAEVLHESSIFSFAGVWETWKDKNNLEHKTYSIITTEPNKEMAAVHNRMPVILHPEDEPKWLEPSRVTRSDVEPLLCPFEDNKLEIYKVSTDVNSSISNDEHLIYALNE